MIYKNFTGNNMKSLNEFFEKFRLELPFERQNPFFFLERTFSSGRRRRPAAREFYTFLPSRDCQKPTCFAPNKFAEEAGRPSVGQNLGGVKSF